MVPNDILKPISKAGTANKHALMKKEKENSFQIHWIQS